jgi:glucosamine-6-phosphate deaminase
MPGNDSGDFVSQISKTDFYGWCKIPAQQLANHPQLKVRFRLVADSRAMGSLMARELAEVVEANNARRLPTRAIIPCGPKCWYAPFSELVNSQKVSLRNLFIFHMDECLDWQAAAPRKPSVQFSDVHPDACLDTLLQFVEGSGKKFAPEFLEGFTERVPDANVVASA